MRILAVVALALVAACGGSSSRNDAPLDDTPGVDTPVIDATPDGMPDGMLDAMTDAMPDAMTDAMTDAMPDAMVDAMPDAMVDAMPDAMVDAMPDAMVDAMVDAMPDAMPDVMPDAMPDAMTDAMPDAMVDAKPGTGPVTVHLVDRNGVAVPGLHVFFVDPDTSVTDVVTDSAGVATANVTPGASVTAVRPGSGITDTACTGGNVYNGVCDLGMGETAQNCPSDCSTIYTLATVQDVAIGDDITLITGTTGAITSQDPFGVRLVQLPSVDVTSAVKPSGGMSATYQTVAPHGFVVGDRVQVTDVAPTSVFEGSWLVTAVPTPTSFTATIATSGGQQVSATGGIAYKQQPYTVTFNSYAGATSYEVHTPCGPTNVGSATTATVYLRDGCATSAMTLLVFAKSSPTTELAYTEQNVLFTPGGNTTITDSWHSLVAVTASYTNPATVSNISVARYTPYMRGAASSSASAVAGNPTMLVVNTATSPAAWMRTTFTGPSTQFLTEQIDGLATTYNHDVGADLLPWITATYNPTITTIDLTITGSGAYDLFHASLKYIRGQAIYTWQIFGPVAQDTTFPILPSNAPGDPTVRTSDAQSQFRADLCESDAIADYRAAIQSPFETFGACEQAATVTTRPFAAIGTRNRLSQSN